MERRRAHTRSHEITRDHTRSQARRSGVDLLGNAAALDAAAIARRLCEVGSKRCGERKRSGFPAPRIEYSDAAAWAEASAAAERIVRAWDVDGDGRLDGGELVLGESKTDGKLSLSSLDPGTPALISPSACWNAFILGLILYFAGTIVEQLAKAEQAERDACELRRLQNGGAKERGD